MTSKVLFYRTLSLVFLFGISVDLYAQDQTYTGETDHTPVSRLVVTNYHVISNLVFSPDHHRAEYVDHNQDKGELELLRFDVVNDLAILRKVENDQSSPYFELANHVPIRGESIYALGNPHDIGMLLVSGAYNGLADYSYTDRILFSGSLRSHTTNSRVSSRIL